MSTTEGKQLSLDAHKVKTCVLVNDVVKSEIIIQVKLLICFKKAKELFFTEGRVLKIYCFRLINKYPCLTVCSVDLQNKKVETILLSRVGGISF